MRAASQPSKKSPAKSGTEMFGDVPVLSGIDPGELVRAIRAQDVGRLTRIPGVGKKTAERIGLELKDRLPRAEAGAAESTNCLS